MTAPVRCSVALPATFRWFPADAIRRRRSIAGPSRFAAWQVALCDSCSATIWLRQRGTRCGWRPLVFDLLRAGAESLDRVER